MLDAVELLKPQTVDARRRSYQNRVFLAVFWRKARKASNKYKRLSLLRLFAGLVLGDDPYMRHNQAAARRHFEKRKGRGAFYLAGGCWVCGLMAECRHHVIQVQHGGRNVKKNIVNLCAECHRSVHYGDKAESDWPQMNLIEDAMALELRP